MAQWRSPAAHTCRGTGNPASPPAAVRPAFAPQGSPCFPSPALLAPLPAPALSYSSRRSPSIHTLVAMSLEGFDQFIPFEHDYFFIGNPMGFSSRAIKEVIRSRLLSVTLSKLCDKSRPLEKSASVPSPEPPIDLSRQPAVARPFLRPIQCTLGPGEGVSEVGSRLIHGADLSY